MARTDEIVSEIASVTGKRVSDVNLTVRRLRERDYWVRETRSPRSPRPTPQHVTHLLVALLSGATAKDAPEAVVETVETRSAFVDDDRQKKINTLRTLQIFPNTVSVLEKERHMFMDALEALIKDIMGHLGDFDGDSSEIRVGFDQVQFCANIIFHFPYFRKADPNQEKVLHSFQFDYVNLPLFELKGLKDFHQYAEIGKETLLAASRKLAVIDD